MKSFEPFLPFLFLLPFSSFNRLYLFFPWLRNALTGGACGKKTGGTALTTGQIVGIVFGVIFGIALIGALIACCVGYCQEWDCVVGTCLGGLCKCFMGCWQKVINLIFIGLCCRLCGVEPLSCVEEE